MPENIKQLNDLDEAIRPLANQLINYYRLSLEKAVAHLSDPEQFPMPDSEQQTENLFLRYLQNRPQAVQQRVIIRFQQREAEIVKSQRSNSREVDLKAQKSIISQFKRNPLTTDIDFAALVPTQVQTKSASTETPLYSGVRLRLKKVVCLDETDPEGGHDEIRLGGIAFTTTQTATKLNPFFVGEFNEGVEGKEEKVYNPPRVLADFTFADDDVLITKHDKLEVPLGWPRQYAFALMLAEEDLGGFFEDIQEIYADVKDKAVEFVEEQFKEIVGELTEEAIEQYAKTLLASIGAGTAIGSIVPGIGNIVGAVAGFLAGLIIGLIFDLIQEWAEDDPFPPREIFLTVFSARQPAQIIQESPITISGHGGLYQLFYDWEFFGEIKSVQNEIRIKETVAPFVSGSYVSTLSDFTLLMVEKSVKTAIFKWKEGANLA